MAGIDSFINSIIGLSATLIFLLALLFFIVIAAYLLLSFFSPTSIIKRMEYSRDVTGLLMYIDNPDMAIRSKATNALWNIISGTDDKSLKSFANSLNVVWRNRLIEFLLEVTGPSQDYDVRLRSITLLGLIKNPLAVDTLIELLYDEDPNVRKKAAFSLVEYNDIQAVEPLIHLLDDDDVIMRKVAMYGLKISGDVRAITPIIGMLDDVDEQIRVDAVNAVITLSIPNEDKWSLYNKMLNDESINIRNTAAQRMKEIAYFQRTPTTRSRENVIREKEVIREIVKIPCKYCGVLVENTAITCQKCGGPV